MKLQEVLISWFLSVMIGSLACGLIYTQSFAACGIFFLLSGLHSIPYLLLAMWILPKVKGFIAVQAVHTGLAMLSAAQVYFLMGSGFLIFLPCYFLVGIVLQGITYYRSRRQEISETEILDSF